MTNHLGFANILVTIEKYEGVVNHMKKLIPLVALLILFTACAPAHGVSYTDDEQIEQKAEYANDFDPEISALEIEQFSSLLEMNGDSIVTDSVEILYDLNDNPSFLLAEIEPQGFAILFRNSSVISEKYTSDGAVNPYRSVSGQKYYAGPMCYIVFNNSTYTDILSGTALRDIDISRAKFATEQTLERLHQMQGDEVK